MKTQSFGRSRRAGHIFFFRSKATSVVRAGDALKDYRKHRENGDERDAPIEAFPTAGFDALEIVSSNMQPGFSKWPDNEGRYWWKLKCKDGREINDFYWKKDEVRGWPDENDDEHYWRKGPDENDDERYWFTVHHAPSGTKIEGFSAEPDWFKGCPDKNKYYWSYIQYTECGAIKEWMEEKDRNYVARLRLQREEELAKVTAQREQRATEEKQQQELEVAAVKKCSANVMSMWAEPKTLTSPSNGNFTSVNINSNEVKDALPALPSEELVIAQANCSYQAKKANQLSFDKGDELIVLKQQSNRWWLCESGGLQGLAPSSCLEIISQTATVTGLPSGFIMA